MVACCCRIASLTSRFASDPDPDLGDPAPTDPVPPPPRGPIIGKVVFPAPKGEQAEAILDGEGRWRCPRLPVLDRVLNVLYEPGRDAGGGLPYGHAELVRVAAWLKGEVQFRR